MNNQGKLWIVSNEFQMLSEVFERDIKKGESCIKYIQEFSNNYQLGFKFKETEQQVALYEMMLLEHMIIISDDEESLVTCYLPAKLTNSQFAWLYLNSNMLSSCGQVIGSSICSVDEDGICWKKIQGIEKIMQEARKNIKLPMKGKGI